ncbi:D-alanyl-D-alanine carboxypeptidase family protein [Paenibacillus solisilvae]|uniref:D-alanyl-D-alanine carboxypeptidase family protein n=1 Tax=Paenibacillus solisilvae TaxID=2486751 RepID=A0ABW0VSR1_9BACL
MEDQRGASLLLSIAGLRKSFISIMVLLVSYAAISNWSTLQEITSDGVQALAAITTEHNEGIAVQDVQGEAALVMDEKTGRILFSKNIHEKLYPASTTKMLTALIALEKGNPNDRVTVGDEVRMRTSDESSAGLYEGEQLTLKDLLAALLLPSGNDAARTIARYVMSQETGKTLPAEQAIDEFAKLMNKRAGALGAKESHFVNPHGLHDPNHYSTAYDLALIAKEARKNKLFRTLVSETEYQIHAGSGAQTLVNRNKLLQQDSGFYYKRASGIKTGFTSEAGYCVVASASSNAKQLIAVVLQSTSTGVWSDAESLLQLGFNKH